MLIIIGKKMAGMRKRENHSNATKCIRVFDESVGCHLIAVVANGKIQVFEGSVRKEVSVRGDGVGWTLSAIQSLEGVSTKAWWHRPFSWTPQWVIVHCPGCPRAFELHKDEAQRWWIWVATPGGDVYSKLLSSTGPCSSNHDLMEMGNGGNQFIFDDLLNHTAPPDLMGINWALRTLPDEVCQLWEQDKVLSCQKDVSCISCASQFLAVICGEGSEMVLLVYSLKDLQSQGSGVAPKMSLPLGGFPLGNETVGQVFQLRVVTSESKMCLSSTQVCVPPHLFSVLFGWNTSFRSLPVVLCSMTDGSVYFHPICLSIVDPQLSWQLLCRVDSPVVDLLSTEVKRALSVKESVAAELHSSLGLPVRSSSHSKVQTFMVVGASGKGCLISAIPTLSSAAYSTDCRKVVTMFLLPGQVNSVCCQGNILYMADLSDQIQKCELSLVCQGGEEKQFSVAVQSELLFSASVATLWFSGEKNRLMCRTVKGDVIAIDSAGQGSVTEGGDSQAVPQPFLKDLLLGVDLRQAALEDLQSTHNLYNAFLHQMKVAAHLLHQHSAAQAMGNQNTYPIHCTVSVQSQAAYYEVNYFLSVEVTNQCEISLSKDWSIVVVLREVMGGHDSEWAAQCDREPPSTHSFPLSHELESKRRIHFTIPITYSPVSCAWTVDISLVLRRPDLQDNLCGQEVVSDCVLVPLTTHVVDLFHFLHVKPAGLSPLQVHPPPGLQSKVAELKHCADSRCPETKSPGPVYSISTQCSAPSGAVCPTPVEMLCRLLRDSQVRPEVLTHPSCSLQSPCGSGLTLSVDTASPPQPFPADISPHHHHTVLIKSPDISMLARARWALSRKLQVLDNHHREVTVEEVRKLIQRTESCLQQLQGIQDKWEKGNFTAQDTLAELYTLYETVHNDLF